MMDKTLKHRKVELQVHTMKKVLEIHKVLDAVHRDFTALLWRMCQDRAGRDITAKEKEL